MDFDVPSLLEDYIWSRECESGTAAMALGRVWYVGTRRAGY
jgi:hypothetical protein